MKARDFGLTGVMFAHRLAMKESKGRMNPAVMNKLLAEKLKG